MDNAQDRVRSLTGELISLGYYHFQIHHMLCQAFGKPSHGAVSNEEAGRDWKTRVEILLREMEVLTEEEALLALKALERQLNFARLCLDSTIPSKRA